jgi:hypothetical protein
MLSFSSCDAAAATARPLSSLSLAAPFSLLSLVERSPSIFSLSSKAIATLRILPFSAAYLCLSSSSRERFSAATLSLSTFSLVFFSFIILSAHSFSLAAFASNSFALSSRIFNWRRASSSFTSSSDFDAEIPLEILRLTHLPYLQSGVMRCGRVSEMQVYSRI